VKIVVPFSPGGTADTLGRLVAQRLTDQLKESFIVENRGGAAGREGHHDLHRPGRPVLRRGKAGEEKQQAGEEFHSGDF
jgi:tripartite-type tricarboxylate transporter receptor subunit TctC